MAGDPLILGTGSSLPDQRIDNDYLEDLFGVPVGTVDEKFKIHSRYWSRDLGNGAPREGASNSQLAAAALREALEAAGLKANELDLLVTATATPDFALPPLAPLVLDHLDITDCAPIDIRAACTGGIAALSVASNAIRAGQARYAGVVASDTFSILLDLTSGASENSQVNLVNAALFGDGAGAIILGAEDVVSDGHPLTTVTLGSIGNGRDPGIWIDEPIRHSQDARLHHRYKEVLATGAELYWHAGKNTASAAGLEFEQIARAIPHQANGHVPELFRELLPDHHDRVFFNVNRVANCAAASILLGLDESVRTNPPSSGDHVMVITAEASKWMYGGAMIDW